MNKNKFQDYKTGQKDYKLKQLWGLQIRVSRDCKSGHLYELQIEAKGLQIGTGITSRDKEIINQGRDYKTMKNSIRGTNW